jgi:dynein intermediate chain
VTANNDGILDLFDLTKDMEQPTAHVKINSYAQNKCKWSADGSIIASGDSAGNVNLMVLSDKLRRLDNSRLENFESILPQSRE